LYRDLEVSFSAIYWTETMADTIEAKREETKRIRAKKRKGKGNGNEGKPLNGNKSISGLQALRAQTLVYT
jgi:hypothetical protein